MFFSYLHGYTYFPIQTLWIVLLYLRFTISVYDLKQDIVKLSQLKEAAKHLQQQFQELLEKICETLDGVDVEILKLRINIFLQSEEESVQVHLDKLQLMKTQRDILNFLINSKLLGYLNYELMKVFENNDEVILAIEEYEQKHKALFSAITFSILVELFRQYPKLAPVSPVSLPEFQIHLKDPWENKTVYDLKEVFEENMISRWPSHLIIKNISCESVILTYTVLPILVPAILKDLRNSQLVKKLDTKGIKMEFSSQQDNTELPVKEYEDYLDDKHVAGERHFLIGGDKTHSLRTPPPKFETVEGIYEFIMHHNFSLLAILKRWLFGGNDDLYIFQNYK